MGTHARLQLSFLLALAVTGIVVAAFIPALQIYLIVDDLEWLDEVYAMAFSPELLFTPTAGFFRPVVKMSYFVNYVFFGSQTSFYAATTLAIHLFNVVLLIVLGNKMWRSPLLASAIAVLFGISPLHAEATLWAAARADSMLLLFTLAILLMFIREKPRHSDSIVVFIFVLCAMGCKESWVVTPAVVFAFLVVVQGQSWRTAIMKTVPIAGFVAAYLGFFFLLPAVTSDRLPTAYGGATLLDGIIRIAGVIAGFVGCGSLWGGTLWQALVVYSCIAGLFWWALRSGRRVCIFGLLWMLFALLPTITVGFHPSRYSYIPLAGLWLVAGDLLAAGLHACGSQRRQLVVGLVVVLCSTVAIMSFFALQVEIEDYLNLGDQHRLLVEMFQAIDHEIPRDQTLFFVNRGTYQAMEDFVFHSRGVPKVGHPRPDGLWHLVGLGPLVNFAANPLSERLEKVEDPDLESLLESEPTVLVFEDSGFSVGNRKQWDVISHKLKGLKRLPESAEVFRFIRTRDQVHLDSLKGSSELPVSP